MVRNSAPHTALSNWWAGVNDHRKLDTEGIGGWIGHVAGEGPSELVESGPKRASNVSNGVREEVLELANGWQTLNAEGVVASIRIELGVKGCLAFWRGEKGVDIGLQTGSVSLRPLMLGGSQLE